MARSRYDELHDFYQRIQTANAGTRYERLAAVVFSAMERDGVVIHDLSVRGLLSDVEHQIDVHIEKTGVKKRILVECKDFDVSGAPVGLGIVRDFQGVVSDVKPDDAWIITCNRFTTDARKYAKAFGIRLATLREFANSDWQNRVHTITADINYVRIDNEHPSVKLIMDDEDLAKISVDLSGAYSLDDDFVILFDGKSEARYGEVLAAVASRVPANLSGDTFTEGKSFDGWISGRDGTKFPLRGMEISFKVNRTATRLQLKADQAAARLLLNDSSGVDFVLWEDALQGYTIDSNGAVHLADGATQKRLQAIIQHFPQAI